MRKLEKVFINRISKLPNIFNPYFNLGCELTNFKCLDDTYTFTLGATRAAQILQKYRNKLNILEACCGGGLVALHLLKEKLSNLVEGFDSDRRAIEKSIKNAKKLNCQHRSHFFRGNLFSIQEVINNLKYHPNLLICNPPWIPVPKGLNIPETINGGVDGVKFIPKIFELGEKLKIKMISLNTSSLSSLEKIWEETVYFKFFLKEVVICFNYFGEFTSNPKIQKHIKSLEYSFISSHKASKHLIGTYQDLYLIINLILGNIKSPKPFISYNQFFEFLRCFQKYGLWSSKFYRKDFRFHFYYFTGDF